LIVAAILTSFTFFIFRCSSRFVFFTKYFLRTK
jgi:hypothetical protein